MMPDINYRGRGHELFKILPIQGIKISTNKNEPSKYVIQLPQELEVRSIYHLYSLKTKSSRCHYVVMTRSETKLSVAIPAPVSGQSAVNVATATSKCSITFLLPYHQDGDVKTKQENVSNILQVDIVPGNLTRSLKNNGFGF